MVIRFRKWSRGSRTGLWYLMAVNLWNLLSLKLGCEFYWFFRFGYVWFCRKWLKPKRCCRNKRFRPRRSCPNRPLRSQNKPRNTKGSLPRLSFRFSSLNFVNLVGFIQWCYYVFCNYVWNFGWWFSYLHFYYQLLLLFGCLNIWIGSYYDMCFDV